MVRQKKPIPTESQLETLSLLNDAKEKFAADLVDLEKAKRAFSAAFVEAVMKHIEDMLPKDLLSEDATEFASRQDGNGRSKIHRIVCTQTEKVYFADEPAANGKEEGRI